MSGQQLRESGRFLLLCAGLFSAVLVVKFAYSARWCPTTQGINGLLQMRHVDYLFIGSSRTRQGYDMRAIERATGKSAYLLAYDGLQPHLAVKLLEYLLDRSQPTIGLIILEAYPYIAMRKPSVEDSRIFYNAPAALKLELLKTWQQTGMSGTDMYALSVAEGNEVLLTAFCTRKLIERRTYHGGYVDKFTPGMPRRRFQQIQEPEGVRQSPGHLTPLETQSLSSMFTLADQHGVPLIMVEPPVPQAIAQGAVYTAGRAELQDLAAMAQIPYCTFSDRLFNPCDNSLFTDPLHTSSKGRSLLSRRIIPLLIAAEKSPTLVKSYYGVAAQTAIPPTAPLPHRHAPIAFIRP